VRWKDSANGSEICQLWRDWISARDCPQFLNGLVQLLMFLAGIGVVISGESRTIFLPERSSICQYPPKISAINIKKQSRARLLLAHPVLYILKIQKTHGPFWKPPFKINQKALGYKLRTATCTISESVSGQWRTQKIFMGGISKCQNFSLH